MSNISEGFESWTRAQCIDSLGIAKASAGDVRSQLYVARGQRYVRDSEFEQAADRADKVFRQLYRLIEHLKSKSGENHIHDSPADYVSR